MGDIRTSQFGGIPFGNSANRPANSLGQPYFNGEAARLEMYTATGWQNIVQEVPGVASITGTYSEATNSGTITVQGTNFVSGAIASAIGTNGVEVIASSTTYNSLVQLTTVFTGLSNAYEPYDIKITNPSNLFGLIPDALYINASPVWVTAPGLLGTFYEQVSISLSATATDSDSTISYALASGSILPSGVTLNSANGLISGILPDISQNTTYSFVINATDGLNVIPRTFSIASSVNQLPVWNTAAGALGAYSDNASLSIQLSATDPESTSVTYSVTSGALPSGLTLSSAGLISGTGPILVSNTTYNFTVTATDGLNLSPRAFSMILNTTLDGATSARAANNAAAILSVKPSTTSGTYWVKGYNNTPMQVYCDMTGSSAGASSGGWMRFDQALVSTYRGTAINEELRRCVYVSPGQYQKNDVDAYLGGVRWDLGTSLAFTGVRQTGATMFSNNGPDGYQCNDRAGTQSNGTAATNPPRPSDAQQLAFINSDYNAGSNGTSYSWSALNSGLTQIHRYYLGYLGNGQTGGAGQANPWGNEVNGAVATLNTAMFHQSDSIGFSGRYLQWNESDGATEWDRIETYTIWLK